MPAQSIDLRAPGPAERGKRITVCVDGRDVTAYEGETIAAVLIATRRLAFRVTARTGAPRGYYCGMGVCHDCLVTMNSIPNVRACITPAQDGCKVETIPVPRSDG